MRASWPGRSLRRRITSTRPGDTRREQQPVDAHPSALEPRPAAGPGRPRRRRRARELTMGGWGYILGRNAWVRLVVAVLALVALGSVIVGQAQDIVALRGAEQSFQSTPICGAGQTSGNCFMALPAALYELRTTTASSTSCASTRVRTRTPSPTSRVTQRAGSRTPATRGTCCSGPARHPVSQRKGDTARIPAPVSSSRAPGSSHRPRRETPIQPPSSGPTRPWRPGCSASRSSCWPASPEP